MRERPPKPRIHQSATPLRSWHGNVKVSNLLIYEGGMKNGSLACCSRACSSSSIGDRNPRLFSILNRPKLRNRNSRGFEHNPHEGDIKQAKPLLTKWDKWINWTK